MLAWMIGTVLAVFGAGWMPGLPAISLSLGIALGAAALFSLNMRQLAWFGLGLAFGLIYHHYWGHSLLEARLPSSLEGRVVAIEGEVVEPPQRRRLAGGVLRQRFVFQAETPVAGKLLLSYYGEEEIRLGQRWRFQARLKRPWGLANPGSFNYQSWLAQHRFAGTGYVREKEAQLLGEASTWHSPIGSWRQRIADLLRAQFAERLEYGVLLALSQGDRSAIGHDQWQAIRRFGLNHLVVISGLHVGLVAAMAYLLGRSLGWRTGHVVAAAVAIVYAAQAGFALSTIRALAMLLCVQWLLLSYRQPRPVTTFTVALLVVGLLDPLATHNAGFWLSFTAVAIIYLYHSRFGNSRGVAALLSLQCLLSLGVGLLAGAWFGGISLLAPLANLVAVPVLTVWLAPLCLLASVVCLFNAPLAFILWDLAALPVAGFYALHNWINASWSFGWLEVGLPAWRIIALLPASS